MDISEMSFDQTWTGRFGNTTSMGFDLAADRYKYDLRICTRELGWIQYDTDQDAPYFGVWVHGRELQVPAREPAGVLRGSASCVPFVRRLRADGGLRRGRSADGLSGMNHDDNPGVSPEGETNDHHR